MKKWMYNVLIGVFIAVFVGSAGYLVYYLINSGREAKSYENLQQSIEDNTVTPRPTINEDGTVTPGDTPPTLVEVIDPETGETVSVLPEFKDLYVQNNDIVGWLQIPGTDISYPVMQTPEEPNYYLKRNFEKESSNHGCLYVQENCDVNTPSDNVVIYGHRMRDRSMFAQLDKFEDKAFWEANPYIYFDTLTEVHTYKIMAVFVTTATEGKGFPYHLFVNADTEEAFNTFVKACEGYSLFDTGVEAQYGDKFITLSTCDYTTTHGRLVVVAKRLG